MAKSGIGGSETRLVSAAGIAIFCLIAAILVLTVLPRNDPRIASLRQAFYDVFSPILVLAGKPAEWISDKSDYFDGLSTLRNENRALERQNIDLRQRVNELTRAQLLMQQYRKLLSLPSEPDLQLVNARVIADLNSPFVHTLVANGGRQIGIEPGQAVMGSNGLVGRVISSGRNSSRILLLTDFNSHIPVVALSSDVQAILSGTNSAQPELQFLPRQASLKDGDLLVTSGRGGQIPIGLPVAMVRLDEQGDAKVRMLDNLQTLNFVRVVIAQQIEQPPNGIQLTPRVRR